MSKVVFNKQILLDMISGDKPTHWVRDDIKFPETVNLEQITLVKATGDEFFPGANSELCAYVRSDAVLGIQSFCVDKKRKVLTLLLAPDAGAHEEEKHE